MKLEHLLFDIEDGIATITLNRPERLNALTAQTMRELGQALARVRDEDAARVAIITGAGRGFCAGGDRKETADRHAAGRGRGPRPRIFGERPFAQAARLFISLEKPTIAAINGPAVGGGLDIALWCDMRIASERATFGEMYIDRGLIPDLGGLFLLPRLVGYAQAFELLLTGDIIDAQTAREIGLVNRVVPHDQLMDAARELARKIISKPPLGVAMTKRALARARIAQWEVEDDYHYALHGYLVGTEDFVEADRAFVEKREPRFKGR